MLFLLNKFVIYSQDFYTSFFKTKSYKTIIKKMNFETVISFGVFLINLTYINGKVVGRYIVTEYNYDKQPGEQIVFKEFKICKKHINLNKIS